MYRSVEQWMQGKKELPLTLTWNKTKSRAVKYHIVNNLDSILVA